MNPNHQEPTRIALSALRDRGFALAVGNALTAHGIGARPSDDVDLFTNPDERGLRRRRGAAANGVAGAGLRHADHPSAPDPCAPGDRLADAREAAPMDRPTFVELLDSARQIPDREYAKYGLGPEETAGLKDRMTGWADELRTRAENPDIDKSMGLVQGGQALPNQERFGAAGGGSHRQSPYQARTRASAEAERR